MDNISKITLIRCLKDIFIFYLCLSLMISVGLVFRGWN